MRKLQDSFMYQLHIIITAQRPRNGINRIRCKSVKRILFAMNQSSTLNCTHGGSEYLCSERSRGFRRNPIRENEGQHREENQKLF